VKFSQELRDASMKAYAAAQARSIEKVFEASEVLSANCAGCHRQWRDRRKQPRCQ
jgi:cytochrome c556